VLKKPINKKGLSFLKTKRTFSLRARKGKKDTGQFGKKETIKGI